jgi:hypothetical protein
MNYGESLALDMGQQLKAQAREFIELLHHDSTHKRGNIAYFRSIKKEIDSKDHKLLSYEDLLNKADELIGLKDVYISPNTFWGHNRKYDNLWQLRSLFVDLDIDKHNEKNNTNLTYKEAYYIFLEMVAAGKIPRPSMIVYSGRGLHIYWRIKDAPKKAAIWWQEIEDKLIKKLKDLGADTAVRDVTRVLRLPGTVNSKNNKVCEIWFTDKKARYSLAELQEKYFEKQHKIYEEQRNKKKSNRGRKPNYLQEIKTPYTLHKTRYEDILKLCESRKWQVNRNNTILDLCYFRGVLGITELEDLLKVGEEINKKFKEPLSPRELKTTVNNSLKYVKAYLGYKEEVSEDLNKLAVQGQRDKRGLWYKNETLIERYEITPEEMELLELKIITKEIKQRRQTLKRFPKGEDGMTDKQREREQKRKKAHELAAQGFTHKQISQCLNVSISTIKRFLNVK